MYASARPPFPRTQMITPPAVRNCTELYGVLLTFFRKRKCVKKRPEPAFFARKQTKNSPNGCLNKNTERGPPPGRIKTDAYVTRKNGLIPSRFGQNQPVRARFCRKNTKTYTCPFYVKRSGQKKTRLSAGFALQRLPLARLWVTHSMVQLEISVLPPLLHAVTWSASISFSL